MTSLFKMVAPDNILNMPLIPVSSVPVFLKQAISTFFYSLYIFLSRNISQLHSLESSTGSVFHSKNPQTWICL